MNRLIGAVVVALVFAGCGTSAARVCEIFSDEGGSPISKQSDMVRGLAWAYRVQSNEAAETRTARRTGLTRREVSEARAAKCADGWGPPASDEEMAKQRAEDAALTGKNDAFMKKLERDVEQGNRDHERERKEWEAREAKRYERLKRETAGPVRCVDASGGSHWVASSEDFPAGCKP